jgi:preprotein translocase subunit YajC
MAAETATTAAPSGPSMGQAPNPLMNFAPIIVVCFILYFLVIRPQQKQAKELRKMLDALKSGDRVLTQGGIYGTVVSLRDGIVILKVADDVKIEVSRSAISQVVTSSTAASTPASQPVV